MGNKKGNARVSPNKASMTNCNHLLVTVNVCALTDGVDP